MSYHVTGTCQRCGGALVVPAISMGIFPPVPTCQKCGSVAGEPLNKAIPAAGYDHEEMLLK